MSILGNTYIKILNNEYEKTYLSQTKIQEYAIVISNEKETQYKNQYNIKIIGKSDNKNKKFILRTNKNIELKYGDLIKLNGEYEKPSVAKNYNGYDYSKYLKTQGIYGIIISNNIKVLEENKINIISTLIYKVKNTIIKNINELLDNDKTSGLLIGLLVGDKSYADEEIIANFKNSSLAHMLAISGQHVGYIILAISFALKMCKVGKKAGKIVSICLLILFMLITGLTPSVTRAGIMAILVLISSLLHRKIDVYTSISISILIILLANPYAMYDIGLWLSFGGTLGIILFQNIISNILNIEFRNVIVQKSIKFIKEMLVISISAQIIIIPIMALNFNKVSLIFWFSNILASPIIAVCIIGGFVSVFISIISLNFAKIFVIPIKILLKILIYISEKISNISFANILVPTPNIVIVIAYYIAIIIWLYKKRVNKKQYIIQKRIIEIFKKYVRLIVVSIIVLFTIVYLSNILNPTLKIHFIDVGQGDSTLIITRTGKKVLIDGGGTNTSYDVGANVLLPYLLDRRIVQIDYAMISHFDNDHYIRSVYCNGKYKSSKCNNFKTNTKLQ